MPSHIHILKLLITILGTAGFSIGQEPCDCEFSDGWQDPLPKIVKVDQESKQFIDAFGRTRFFHGTNVVTKYGTYHPDVGGSDICNATLTSPFCDADMDYVQELGLNVVRLGVMWPGAEPIRGEYNCTYFCVIHGIIRNLARRGVYTLIDVHQDVLARQFCQNGAPDWVVKPDWISNESFRFPYPLAQPFTVDENGMPDPWSQCWEIGSNWFLSYLTPAVGDAFQKLYDNHDGLLDSFANYWKKIGVEFHNYSSVLGYNLMNEPWAGDIFSDPALLIPGWADQVNLHRAWEACTTKIREVDDETIIFFEGVTWDILDGHPTVPGGDGSKTAISYHFYAPPQIELHTTFKSRWIDYERLQTGGMLTEFRTWPASSSENADFIDRTMRDTVEAADKYLQSWIGWDYRGVQDRNVPIARKYGRTYAAAIAGRVISTGFIEDTGYFWVTWEVSKQIGQAPTEINFNGELFYTNGLLPSVTPSEFLTWTIKENATGTLVFWYTEYAVNGENVTIEFRHSPSPITSVPPSSTTSVPPSSTTPVNGVMVPSANYYSMLLATIAIIIVMTNPFRH